MLISTFELLLKPQLPSEEVIKRINPSLTSGQREFLVGLTRTIIQGYFLTLANPSKEELDITIVYTLKPQLPDGLDFNQLITFFDAAGNQEDARLNLTTLGDDKYSIPSLKLAPRETVLLLLQPNFIEFTDLLSNENFEARGYAEIFLGMNSSSGDKASVLVTPEHRGTFYKENTGGTSTAPVSLGEIAYSLPVQNGGFLELVKT